MDPSPNKRIPLFPLNILPLPGELTPLHIFEPRYRQLLFDAEAKDITFGIYYNHSSNEKKYGALVKLESVIKRYQSGESDIIVKCLDVFTLSSMSKSYRDKLYPGGEVRSWQVDLSEPVSPGLLMEFVEYMAMLKMYHHPSACSVFHIANELNMDVKDKMDFLSIQPSKREQFLFRNLQFQRNLITAVEKSKDVFHLN
jgi:Lon protease-like protein